MSIDERTITTRAPSAAKRSKRSAQRGGIRREVGIVSGLLGLVQIDADTLETIVNGATVSVEPLLPLGGGPSKKFVNQVTVDVDPKAPRTWVVFHAKGETDLAPLHPGRRPFAVSNPVFLKAP